MTIPTYREASDRRCEGQETAMDYFITEWMPVPPEADDFRADLQKAVSESCMETIQRTVMVCLLIVSLFCICGSLLRMLT